MSSAKSRRSGGLPDDSDASRFEQAGHDRPPRVRTRRATTASPGEEARQQPEDDAGQPGPSPTERPLGWSFRDFLVPYILLALSIQRAHGYMIEQYLRGLGLVNLEMSTLYRTLRQLEKDGLVYSSWEPGSEGPARRVYTLTEAGRWWLDAGASALRSYRSLIDHFFGSYSGPAPKREADK